jgi:FkbM family methyltransferase
VPQSHRSSPAARPRVVASDAVERIQVRKLRESVADAIRAHPRLHTAARTIKRARRRTFEQLGSDRYSHPAYEDLDRKLAGYLPQRGGIFVEAGAYDGYWGSNTYWFERFRGWSGVLIEPLPELANLARKERPRSQVFQCALVPPEYREDVVKLRYGGTMSVLAGAWDGDEEEHARTGAHMEGLETFEIEVPARMISEILDEASITHIDLMTLDVEGFEASVLRGLDLTRHSPQLLLIEMLKENQERPVIEATLGVGYRHEAKLSSRDHLYRRVAGGGSPG